MALKDYELAGAAAFHGLVASDRSQLRRYLYWFVHCCFALALNQESRVPEIIKLVGKSSLILAFDFRFSKRRQPYFLFPGFSHSLRSWPGACTGRHSRVVTA